MSPSNAPGAVGAPAGIEAANPCEKSGIGGGSGNPKSVGAVGCSGGAYEDVSTGATGSGAATGSSCASGSITLSPPIAIEGPSDCGSSSSAYEEWTDSSDGTSFTPTEPGAASGVPGNPDGPLVRSAGALAAAASPMYECERIVLF